MVGSGFVDHATGFSPHPNPESCDMFAKPSFFCKSRSYSLIRAKKIAAKLPGVGDFHNLMAKGKLTASGSLSFTIQ